MSTERFDFSGWATKNDILCSDGRTIRRNAFAHNDGEVVPLVWQHRHDSPENVIGKMLLENRPEGVYGYGSFNNSKLANDAKELVRHGDVSALSIFANQLQQRGGDVLHGNIREVSLVLSGANEGAKIDFPVLEHSDGSLDIDYTATEAWIYNAASDDDLDTRGGWLEHTEDDSEDSEDTEYMDEYNDIDNMDDAVDEYDDEIVDVDDEVDYDDYDEDIEEDDAADIFDSLDDDQKEVVYEMLAYAAENSDVHNLEDVMEHSGMGGDPTINDIFNTLTPMQKDAVYAMIAIAVENADELQESNGGIGTMKHNAFDYDEYDDVLSHSDMMAFEQDVISDAKNYGSMKDAYLAHAAEYGIDNIDMLFPEPKDLNVPPEFISRKMDWVSAVMNGVHNTPFSRIKSVFADITAEEARAKGYTKTHQKLEEVFTLLKRITTPTTVYKKQKFDRDDLIDITDFDVLAWVKKEMRTMLDEEIARAILVGDGRSTADNDKINESNIRPIATDDDLFAIKVTVTPANGENEAHAVITSAVRARKEYKGSGQPTLFCTEDFLADALLMEDTVGHRLYKTESELATAMRVSKIVEVPILGDNIYGIIVNLDDYNVGADKGGAVNMFDDFDSVYNQQKYLIETRCSGALTKPYSAIVLKKNA